MIDLAFDDGERVADTLPLAFDTFRVVDHAGEVVSLELHAPESRESMRERNRFHAVNEAITAELTVPGATLGEDGEPVRVARTDVDPDRVAALASMKESALAEWAASTVRGWSYKKGCTREGVLKLFDRYPSVLELVIDRMGDRDRFLHASLRPVVSESEPVPTVTA